MELLSALGACKIAEVRTTGGIPFTGAEMLDSMLISLNFCLRH